MIFIDHLYKVLLVFTEHFVVDFSHLICFSKILNVYSCDKYNFYQYCCMYMLCGKCID